MEETVKIGCPNCGSVLMVKYVSGIETKSVLCPVCKQSTAFTKFRKIESLANDEPTQYPGGTSSKPQEEAEPTQYAKKNTEIGRIIADGRIYPLRLGKNVIGRKSGTSSATIQLTTASKRLSREHIVIDVKNVPGVGIAHHVSLYKKVVNVTFVNNIQLEFGDVIVLNTHDIIKLPDIDVKFEIPDEDETQLT